jgi:hypothetical protein
VERKGGEAVACVTAYVAPEIARALKLRAVSEGRTGSELVEQALAAMLSATEAA